MKTITLLDFNLRLQSRCELYSSNWARYTQQQSHLVSTIVHERDDTSLQKTRGTSHCTRYRIASATILVLGAEGTTTIIKYNAVAVDKWFTMQNASYDKDMPHLWALSPPARTGHPQMLRPSARRRGRRRWITSTMKETRADAWPLRAWGTGGNPRGPTSTASEHPTDYSRTWSVSRTLRSLLLGVVFCWADRYAARFRGLSRSRARSPLPFPSSSINTLLISPRLVSISFPTLSLAITTSSVRDGSREEQLHEEN